MKRDFTADRPNRLWLTDITYVASWAGVAYGSFIVDAYSRMIVGWRVAGHTRMRWHQPTIDHVTRRTVQGLSEKDIIRCLKRFVAREIYNSLILDDRARVPLAPAA